MWPRIRRRRESESPSGEIPSGESPRGERREDRKERREKRREFFLALSSNVKWIMLAAAVIAVILFAKFGIPTMLTGGV